ncbi:hypothetical protein RND81_12G067100 [Saponaria officinalis]|uniref:Reverse transcriptase domain-containing protein n=1 Tax=Saponaria officinalis TaxID=3572 RepID=A0AAW1H7F3_SAPOF
MLSTTDVNGSRTYPSSPQYSFHPKCVQLSLNHLIFADDLLLFTRGDIPSVGAVVRCLQSFASVSGLHANLEKTQIYFGGVATDIKRQLLQSTGFSEGALPFKYLGLPLSSSRLKRVHNLVYWCLVLKLPKGVIRQIEGIVSSFYWGSINGVSHMHWMKWSLFSRPRLEGGLGIKEILSWNKALMLKWLWRLEAGIPSLWAKWVRAYLLKHESIWSVSARPVDHWLWKGLLEIRDDLVSNVGSSEHAAALIASWSRCSVDASRFCLQKAYHYLRTPGIRFLKLRGL